MNTLRVLLIEESPEESERISAVLANANYAVLPAAGFEEASEALSVQRVDIVLVDSRAEPDETAAFAAKLKAFERSQSNSAAIPVLHFEPAALADLANRISEMAVLGSSEPGADVESYRAELPVFEPEGFRAQVCNDRDLLVEIIELFLTERTDQIAEMQNALAAGDYPDVARLAHTIKGSLGSLHAPRARSAAEELELAAKKEQARLCEAMLVDLEQNLAILEPVLLALRESESQQ